jgi:hypothetical protein
MPLQSYDSVAAQYDLIFRARFLSLPRWSAAAGIGNYAAAPIDNKISALRRTAQARQA